MTSENEGSVPEGEEDDDDVVVACFEGGTLSFPIEFDNGEEQEEEEDAAVGTVESDELDARDNELPPLPPAPAPPGGFPLEDCNGGKSRSGSRGREGTGPDFD